MPSISTRQFSAIAPAAARRRRPRRRTPPAPDGSATMTWIGGVKRYWPVFSKLLPLVVQVEHQRGGVALAVSASAALAADHEAEARHALDALVRRGRERVERRSRARRAAARRRRSSNRPASCLPCCCASAPISAIGLRMPEVVSQWTAKTWVIAASAFSRRSTAARSGGVSSGVSCTDDLARRRCRGSSSRAGHRRR